MSSYKKIAAFGLGSMGYGIASSILKGGHTVYGFDVAPAPVELFVRVGGSVLGEGN